MLTGTRARSRREHILQAKPEQLPVKKGLHRIKDPTFVICRSSNHTMAFSACVETLEILVQTCPNVSTKTELCDTPVKLVMLMFRVHTTDPCPIKVSKERHIRQSLFSSKETSGTRQWPDQRGLLSRRARRTPHV